MTREDVGRSYNSAITDSGFSLRIAQSMLHRETPLRVNLIGVSGDEATRLKYTAKLSEQIFESLFIRDCTNQLDASIGGRQVNSKQGQIYSRIYFLWLKSLEYRSL